MHSAALFLVMAPQFVVRRGASVPKPNVRTMVKNMIDSRLEHKRCSATITSTDALTAGVVIPISAGVVQGDDINQRSGDVISPRTLAFRLEAQVSSASFTSYSLRCIIFQDTINPFGTLPAVTEVLATASPQSCYNVVHAQQTRFKILYDGIVNPVGQTSMTRINVVKSIPMKGKIHYSATTGAASSSKNSLYALFITENSQAGITVYNWAWELVYLDA